jgi:glycosyltransferase involved in cell wall biosynthesis
MKKRQEKPQVAIFDYEVCADSAMGGCHLRMLEGLCGKYDFTVFAVKFENPNAARIRFVRIPAPTRPTVLLSLVFHLLSPLYFAYYCLRYRARFDLVEKMEVFTFVGRIAYIHFCYRAYLEQHWKTSKQPGLRGVLLSLDHITRAYLLEPIIYRFAQKLIVPSRGLARELVEAYPFTQSKIHLLPNFTDFTRLANIPASFDRKAFRASNGFDADDLVLVFVALGQFERKGLPQLLDAMSLVSDPHVKLLVVGGSSHWMEFYAERAAKHGLRERVAFTGRQRDVAPYLWMADVFAMPSRYETFLLVALEAAAAGLPVIVTRLHGVEDYIEDRVSGMYVERTPHSIAAAIRELSDIGPEGRRRVGNAARHTARKYTVERFVANWDAFLGRELEMRGYLDKIEPREVEFATPE